MLTKKIKFKSDILKCDLIDLKKHIKEFKYQFSEVLSYQKSYQYDR